MSDHKSVEKRFHSGYLNKSFIYAIGFSDDTVKIGRTRNPKNRFSTHSADRARSDVEWLHLFEPCCHKSIYVPSVEAEVVRQMSMAYQRVRRTETFSGTTRKGVIEITRKAIRDAKRAAAAKAERRVACKRKSVQAEA